MALGSDWLYGEITCGHYFRNLLDHAYQPNDPWGLGGPFNHSTAVDLAITSDAHERSVAKTVAKIPPVLSGMDKAEALAFVSRLFDAAQAGAVLWGDELLLKRFLEQCSRRL